MTVIKKISELEQMPVLSDTANVLVEENGEAKRFPAKALGGGSSAAETDEKYFNIDDDGLLSLKPEYRGVGRSDCEYSISDNGVNAEGSRMSELPEIVVIPDIVNEIAVTALAPAMFLNNLAVKSLTIPNFIAEIPLRFCQDAKHLKDINGTENVKILGSAAFQRAGITRALFPKLKEMQGAGTFNSCARLVIADIGEVTAIPYLGFGYCVNLSAVRGGTGVTNVGLQGFIYSHRLKNLSFAEKLTTVETDAFRFSRNYLGNVYPKINNTDFWSGCTYTACNTPVLSTFNQNNPLWVNKPVGGGSGDTYAIGCLVCAAASIYSTLEGKKLTSPEEFVDAVKNANADLMGFDINEFTTIKQWLEALGYTAEIGTYSEAGLQNIYNALSDGALVIGGCLTQAGIDGHAVLFHGINNAGELLVVDSDGQGKAILDYVVDTFAMPIQNMSASGDEFIIVRKK